MRRFRLVSTLAIGLASTACGSSGSSTLDPNLGGLLTNGAFKATINGAAWSPIGTVLVSRLAGGLTLSATSTMVTTLTSNHVAGTFTFNAPANPASTASTLHVTGGIFDLTF